MKKLKNYHSKNYTKKAFNNARQLRKKENMTDAEKLLWYYIRDRRMNNCRFRKQVAIGNYIVDFLCPEKKLIIELDGGQHNEDRNIIYDNERTKYLNGLGYKVIRFWDNDIFKNMKEVWESIYEELKDDI